MCSPFFAHVRWCESRVRFFSRLALRATFSFSLARASGSFGVGVVLFRWNVVVFPALRIYHFVSLFIFHFRIMLRHDPLGCVFLPNSHEFSRFCFFVFCRLFNPFWSLSLSTTVAYLNYYTKRPPPAQRGRVMSIATTLKTLLLVKGKFSFFPFRFEKRIDRSLFRLKFPSPLPMAPHNFYRFF